MAAIVISSVSTKGGVGKTSLVKHLAIIKKEENKRVLIIDLCQNSDIATRLGYNRYALKYDTYDWVSDKVSFETVVKHDKETGIDFIPASNLVERIIPFAEKANILSPLSVLKDKIEEIRDKYDYIFLDNHPTETTNMMKMSLVASQLAIVPTVMDRSSILHSFGTIEIIESVQKAGINIEYAVVPHAIDLSPGKGFRKELAELLQTYKQMDIVNVTSPVRYSSVVMKAGLNDEVIRHDSPYMEKVLDDYREVAKQIEELLCKEMEV